MKQKILRLLRDIAADGRIGGGYQRRGGREGGRTGRAGRGEGGRKINRRTPDNEKIVPLITNLYCWVLMGCNHVSNNYTREAQGHMDDTMMDNRLAGSTAFCQPVEY